MVPLSLLGVTALVFEHSLSLSSQHRSCVLRVGGNPLLQMLQRFSYMGLSFAAGKLTQVSPVLMQVAVNRARFLIHQALMEAYSVPYPKLG